MKKTLKRLGALALVLCLVLALSSVAWAADDTYTGSGNDNADNFTGLNDSPQTIPITKGIIFFNANGSNVYEPNVTFSYAVTPDMNVAEDGSTATVTDGQTPPVVRKVYRGPTNGVTGTTISFAANTTNGTHTTAADGAEVEQSGNLGLDISKFSKPGIYRYLITESVTNPSSGTNDSENLQLAGLAKRDDNYKNTRYLDVYIRYFDHDSNPDTDPILQMYGAVIFVSTESTPGTDSITTNTEKTTGFEPGVGGTTNYADDKNVDKYYTYDFTVKKTVSGSMADKNHEFPFYVTVSNSINGAMFTYTADDNEAFTGATNVSGVVTLTSANFSIGADSKTSSLKLKNNDTIKLVGVPSNQSTELAVVIKEFNDTYDEYTPSASAKKGTLSMTTGNAMSAVDGFDSTASFAVKTNDVESQILAIDNNLTEISPTGVVLRFAPYALMLCAGVVLLVLSRRRRMADDEA